MNRMARACGLALIVIPTVLSMACRHEEGAKAEKRFPIVAIGDSYASGEGAPDYKFKLGKYHFFPDWKCDRPIEKCRRCNSSSNAGTKQASDILKGKHPEVDFKTFACAGATITKGLIGPYEGAQPGLDPDKQELPPQVSEVSELSKTDPITALTISIGGNDILFSRIVAACMIPGNSCRVIDPIIEGKLDELDELLGELKANIDGIEQLQKEPYRVFLTQYPDPTHDTNNDYCDKKPEEDPLGGITKCEARWASKVVLQLLNYKLCKFAHDAGWTYVDGIADKFDRHGWCAEENWIDTFTESVSHQLTYLGTMHPKRRGYQVYGDRLAEKIEPLLQPGGMPTSDPCGDADASPPEYKPLSQDCPDEAP